MGSKSSSHTKTPWYRRGPLAEDESGIAGGVPVDIVAVSDDEETIDLLDELSVDDADFIVKAVNSHEALVAACRLTALHFARMAASDQFMGDDEHEAWSALEKAIQAASGAPEDGK